MTATAEPSHARDRSIVPRSARFVIYHSPDTYAPFPRLMSLSDGRLAVGTSLNTGPDHYMLGEWCVFVSPDGGANWSRAEDAVNPAIPFTWPGSSPREKWDRATRRLTDGTLFATGAVGWQAWPVERRAEAEAGGLFVEPRHPPNRPDLIRVGTNTVFTQRSRDGGQTWERREIALPRAGYTLGFPRDVTLRSGTLLAPLRSRSNGHGQALVLHVSRDDDHVRLFPIPRDVYGATGSEAALVEVAPDRVLWLMRADPKRGGDGHLLASWSDDGGRTWSFPTVTGIWGYPPHLLHLADGRLLCTYGHRRTPLGVQAAVSIDGGETWDIAHRAILADNGETGDLGYPMSVQLSDGSIYTAYYVTKAGVTHCLGLRWELPW